MIPWWPRKIEILPFCDNLTPGKSSTVQILMSDLCHPQMEDLPGTWFYLCKD